MPANFDGTSAELQSNINIEDIDIEKLRKIHLMKKKYQKIRINRIKEEKNIS